jgi:hypothetical protein
MAQRTSVFLWHYIQRAMERQALALWYSFADF